VVTNRIFAPLAGRVPPWVIVEHRGRRSGRVYRTVVWAFPYRGDLVFALTYGPKSDWVRNVVAAGSARVKWRGSWRSFSRVELREGWDGLRLLPAVIRPSLYVAGIRSVLRLS
jgi:deazaflavin-dependent oxidoreductase (nitroreductase family)